MLKTTTDNEELVGKLKSYVRDSLDLSELSDDELYEAVRQRQIMSEELGAKS